MLTFYTICFGVGVLMSVVSVLGSALHLPQRFHFRVAKPSAKFGVVKSGPAQLSHFNFAAMVVFLAFFGGSGMVLESRGVVSALSLVVALVGGTAGGSAINRLLRALLRFERPLEHTSYVGVVGRVVVPIRERGTGEIVFSFSGTRRCAGARSTDGAAITRGAEVVVMRFENGLAYVQPWNDFITESPP